MTFNHASEPVYIVAEIGCNWKSDYELLKRMCRKAQMSGCNAVKFQALSQPLIDRHPEWDWYEGSSISPKNVDFVKRIVEDMGLDFFVTPTYAEAVVWLTPFVNMFKIRHADRNDESIVAACVNSGKKVILSTDRPIDIYYEGNLHKYIKQIYCIPKYPTEYGELNFSMIKLLPGYSNHCLNPLAIIKAVRHGAKYIEYHLTDNRDDFAIDNKVSMSYGEMDEVNRWIRLWEDHGST